jgi:hypothetical protein
LATRYRSSFLFGTTEQYIENNTLDNGTINLKKAWVSVGGDEVPITRAVSNASRYNSEPIIIEIDATYPDMRVDTCGDNESHRIVTGCIPKEFYRIRKIDAEKTTGNRKPRCYNPRRGYTSNGG